MPLSPGEIYLADPSGVPISGSNSTLSIAGPVSTYTQGPQAVSGTVNVGNWPPVIGVSGSTTLKVWDPGVQAFSGSVYTQGPQAVTGSVNVYTQGPQLVSGTVFVMNSGSTGFHVGNSQLTPLYITISSSLPVTGNFGAQDSQGRSLIVGGVPSGSTFQSNPIPMGGVDTSDTVGIGDIVRAIAVDSQGRIITAPAGTNTTNGFSAGHVTTAATTQVSVRGTTYTEPTTSAQRSIVSTSASDAAAGTGARTVELTYFDSSGNGPYTETITLNGTTAVNTVSTTICYIEKMRVVTAGTGGSNAGTINLKSTTAGGGTTIWSIAIGDNQTFGAHHYTPVGKTTYITGLSVSHNGTTVGSGAAYVIKSLLLGVANAIEQLVSDEPRLYGQSSTVARIYGTPIKITGPARTTVYVTPETTTSTVYRAAFDFYDQ